MIKLTFFLLILFPSFGFSQNPYLVVNASENCSMRFLFAQDLEKLFTSSLDSCDKLNRRTFMFRIRVEPEYGIVKQELLYWKCGDEKRFDYAILEAGSLLKIEVDILNCELDQITYTIPLNFDGEDDVPD